MKRLLEIRETGGVDAEVRRTHALAQYFRTQLQVHQLPFKIVSEALSNAVTPLHPTGGLSAYDIFTVLKDEYGIWVCPNGGALKDEIFRVGHIGALTNADYDKLIAAMLDMQKRGLLGRSARQE